MILCVVRLPFTCQLFSNGRFPYNTTNLVALDAARSSQLVCVYFSHTLKQLNASQIFVVCPEIVKIYNIKMS